MPIETEEEYERLLACADELLERDGEDLSPGEGKLLDLLVTLIEKYEEDRYPPRGVTPLGVLQHLMEAWELTHKDVWTLFGSKGIASEVLHRKQSISKAQAKKLAEFFHVSVALFIQETGPPPLGAKAISHRAACRVYMSAEVLTIESGECGALETKKATFASSPFSVRSLRGEVIGLVTLRDTNPNLNSRQKSRPEFAQSLEGWVCGESYFP